MTEQERIKELEGTLREAEGELTRLRDLVGEADVPLIDALLADIARALERKP